eukprot:11098638-Alexandrium_andersonii.AAC.1
MADLIVLAGTLHGSALAPPWPRLSGTAASPWTPVFRCRSSPTPVSRCCFRLRSPDAAGSPTSASGVEALAHPDALGRASGLRDRLLHPPPEPL